MSDDVLGDGERLLETLHRQDCERARARMATDPLSLTDHDLVVLHNYGDEGEDARAWQARQKAQLALVQKNQPAVQTKAASPVDRSRRPVTHTQLKQFADQYGDVLIDIIKKAVVPLKEKIAQLEARCLELEARDAARMAVLHDD